MTSDEQVYLLTMGAYCVYLLGLGLFLLALPLPWYGKLGLFLMGLVLGLVFLLRD